MDDLRNIMSGIFTKAIEWQILPDSYLNPIHRVKLPSKWSVREKRILSEDQTIAVLARLADPYLLINETWISAGLRRPADDEIPTAFESRGVDESQSDCDILDEISTFEDGRGRPLLSVVVVQSETGRPGDGSTR